MAWTSKGAEPDQPDTSGQSLQNDIVKLVEASGLASIAKDVGFLDKNNEIDKLKTYDASIPVASISSSTSTASDDNVRRSKRSTKGYNSKYIDPTPSILTSNSLSQNNVPSILQSQPSQPSQGSPYKPAPKRKTPLQEMEYEEDDLDDDEDPTEPANKKLKANNSAAVKLPMPVAQNRDDGSKGLRHFSQKVCEKVQSKGSTTYNEVADELVNDLNESGELGQEVDAKNIRRRVYDALNVLMAMKIIEKEKKEIRWKGLPTSDSNRELDALKRERAVRQDRIQKKKEYLSELEIQSKLYKALIDRNMKEPIEDTAERVQLPFIIIHTKKETAIECEMSEDRTEYFFDFSHPFSIHDDNEILKRMGLLDEPSGKSRAGNL
jgi:hypothetical protein